MRTLLSCKQEELGDPSPSSSEEGKDEVFLILERNHCGDDKREIKTTDKKLKSMNGMMVEEKAF